jgi:hypothetical protein
VPVVSPHVSRLAHSASPDSHPLQPSHCQCSAIAGAASHIPSSCTNKPTLALAALHLVECFHSFFLVFVLFIISVIGSSIDLLHISGSLSRCASLSRLHSGLPGPGTSAGPPIPFVLHHFRAFMTLVECNKRQPRSRCSEFSCISAAGTVCATRFANLCPLRLRR